MCASVAHTKSSTEIIRFKLYTVILFQHVAGSFFFSSQGEGSKKTSKTLSEDFSYSPLSGKY